MQPCWPIMTSPTGLHSNMFFVLAWMTGLCAREIKPWLSPFRVIDDPAHRAISTSSVMALAQELDLVILIWADQSLGSSRPSSINYSLSNVASLAPNVRAIYSASVNDSAMLMQHQLTRAPLSMKMYPEVDFQHSLSRGNLSQNSPESWVPFPRRMWLLAALIPSGISRLFWLPPYFGEIFANWMATAVQRALSRMRVEALPIFSSECWRDWRDQNRTWREFSQFRPFDRAWLSSFLGLLRLSAQDRSWWVPCQPLRRLQLVLLSLCWWHHFLSCPLSQYHQQRHSLLGNLGQLLS